MQTVARKSLKLKACPRCGGDVCRMRDTFGVYHQCAQCGREIRRIAPTQMPNTAVASMTAETNADNHREKLMV